MDNAVIYARYSSDKQTEQSIEGQLRDCRAYAEQLNLNIVGEYIDRALSGRYADRPQFQQMIKDAKKHGFKYVLVYKLDRFTRNRYDSAIYKNELKKHGVKVLSAMERLTDDPESILLESLLEATAEYYSVELAQKVNRGMRETALKANYTGGSIPPGYRIESKKYVIDEKTAPIVRMIFDLYTSGKGKKEIVDILTEHGYKTCKNKPFTINTLTYILSNEKYIGTYKYNNIIIEDGCPAIIDKSTFKKAQEIADRTKRAPAAAKAKVDYLLTGKIFCGYCGAPMIGECGNGNSGKTYHYYTCATRRRKHTCTKKNEKKGYIEWYITEQTQQYILHPKRIDYIVEQILEAYNREFNSEALKSIEKEIDMLDKELDKCVDKLLSTDIPSIISKINERAADLEKQKINATKELQKMKICVGAKVAPDELREWLASFRDGGCLDPEYQKRIINTFINAIYLYDDKVVIYYNSKGAKQISFIEMLEDLDFETASSQVSDNSRCGVPHYNLSEQVRWIFKSKLFGIVMPRN